MEAGSAFHSKSYPLWQPHMLRQLRDCFLPPSASLLDLFEVELVYRNGREERCV